MPHRLLVTATSATAAANVDGIPIHFAFILTKDSSYQRSRNDVDEARLIIDEVSMLGAQTLYAVNEKLCTLRESRQDFGGIPLSSSVAIFTNSIPFKRSPFFSRAWLLYRTKTIPLELRRYANIKRPMVFEEVYKRCYIGRTSPDC
jgi:hypothetical protein